MTWNGGLLHVILNCKLDERYKYIINKIKICDWI